MISYICNNCGVTVTSESGMLPAGWYTMTLNVMAPAPPAPAEGEPPMAPTMPSMKQAHAHNQECYDALVASTTFGVKKK